MAAHDAPAPSVTNDALFPGEPGAGGKRARWLAALVVSAIVIALLALSLSRSRSTTRALRDLPAPERATLFTREMASFRSLCGAGPRPDALEDRCLEKARFLLQFPECDAACQELLRPHFAPESPR
ncbi:MAG: hypothetical protein U0166_20230 [Acidobacteriota bacterium]